MLTRATHETCFGLYNLVLAVFVVWVVWVASAVSAPSQSWAASSVEVKVSKAAQNEQYERDVDAVALASQEKAISKLSALLKKYTNTRQEPTLLLKLAELQQQYAAILSRIAHGSAHRSGKAINLTRFRKSITESINTLTTLMTKYPNYEEIYRAYFMRGKGHEELENVVSATKDYLHLVKHFPDADEVPSAYMSLAEFSIKANDHARAVEFLKEVEKRPEDPRYPFALFKLAWAHYNLKKIPAALSYAERQIAYYNAKAKNSEDAVNATSDLAFKENMLLDTTTFFLEGFEEKLPEYQLSEALPYFRKLDNGPVLGRMALRFAKLLRSHGHEQALISWKDQILSSESKRSESLDVIIVTYEYQLNKRRYQQLTETSRDFVKLYAQNKNFESFPKAQKLLLDTAEGLQTLVIKNKDATEVQSLSTTLATIYDSFTRIVDESDPRIPRVHYNLAETLFTIKDFSGATEHYRWVVEHGSWSQKKDAPANVVDSSLKAIASRYEVLRQKQLIPKEVTAQPLAKDSTKELDPLLGQWVKWIDTHVKYDKKNTENFIFEANRALYAAGHIVESVDRMKSFSGKFPKSEYAIPSASLVIDTYIASADWEKTHDLATEFLEVTDWKKHEFSKKLFAVAADSAYKLIEIKHKAKDFKGTLKAADDFLDQYSSSARLADCLSLAGNAALEIKDKKKAHAYFSRLIKEAGKSDSVGPALLARAHLEEEKYRFSSAAGDYKSFLALPPALTKMDEPKLQALRRKTMMLSWLSGDQTEFRSTLNSKLICNEALIAECQLYAVVNRILSGDRTREEDVTKDAFENSQKSNGKEKALWAVLALDGAKNLSWRDRLKAIRAVAAAWDELDSIVKFSLIPSISVSIPRAFQMNRMGMREIAPLRADERYITRRVEVIREIENTAAKVMKMPWARVRAESLNEIAALYLDLARGLASVSPPKGLNPAELAAYEETIRKLVLPFEEKGQEMRAKAFEIASRFAIEESSFNAIAEPFFSENPSQAKALKPLVKIEKPGELGLDLLNEIDPIGKWDWVKKGKAEKADEPALYLKVLWAESLKAKRWPQVAFFLQEAHEKKLFAPGSLGAVKAVSLAGVGARGEALTELDEARKELEIRSRTTVLMTLVQYSMHACSRARIQSLLKDIQADQLSSEQASFIARANAYATSKAQ